MKANKESSTIILDENSQKNSRISSIIKTLIEVAGGNYSVQIKLSDKEDDIDLIAKGINMMIDDIRNGIEKIENERNYSHNIIDSMLDVLIVLNQKAIIQVVNQATARLLGYRKIELVGQPLSKILPPDKKKTIEDNICMKFLKVTELKNMDLELLTKQKETIPVSMSCSVMRDKKEKTTGIVLARDMREVKHLIGQLLDKSIKLSKANKELKESTVKLIQSEKMSALGELTAGVAHELNQPLNTIKIICQSIIRDIHKHRFQIDEVEPDLNDVVDQVDKMADIIGHMRIFTRQTGGLPYQKIEVNYVVEGTLKFIEQQLHNHNIKLEIQLGNNLPRIMGDSISLEQALLNLLTNARNALDQSEKDDKFIKIETSALKNQKVIVMAVTDNGIGISKSLKKKIFNPFFTTKPQGKGIGLGLSVTGKIIEEHKGEIKVDSKAGKGTTFKIILPYIEDVPVKKK